MIHQASDYIKLSINSIALESKPPDTDPVWRQMANTWETHDVSPAELEYFIRKGHSFSAALTNTYRHSDNFRSTQHVCLDFDTDDERSSFDVLGQDPWLQQVASFAYTTPSHGVKGPRARVVIFLTEPVYDIESYKLGVEALLEHYDYADHKCKDAVRWWLGSYDCEILRYQGNQELTTAGFLDAGKKRAERIEAARSIRAFVASRRYNGEGDPDTYNGQLPDLMVQDILNAPKGQRNNTYYSKGVKTVARYGLPDGLPILERLRDAAISSGLSEHEANNTHNSILRSNPQ